MSDIWRSCKNTQWSKCSMNHCTPMAIFYRFCPKSLILVVIVRATNAQWIIAQCTLGNALLKSVHLQCSLFNESLHTDGNLLRLLSQKLQIGCNLFWRPPVPTISYWITAKQSNQSVNQTESIVVQFILWYRVICWNQFSSIQWTA